MNLKNIEEKDPYFMSSDELDELSDRLDWEMGIVHLSQEQIKTIRSKAGRKAKRLLEKRFLEENRITQGRKYNPKA